jgi:putative DNA primase/helicase
MMQLMGDYGTTLPMQTLMEQPFGGGQTNDLASLLGKRFVTASEGEASQKLAESKIKWITGGDRIKCRHLYKDFFEFDPQFKLWLATNNLPAVSGSDDAVWRRIRVVEFPISIPPEDQDKDLVGRLIAELPGIFDWSLKGYRQWKEMGLCPPDQVLMATTSYREDNDFVQQWLKSCCVSIKNHDTSMKALYESYRGWCEEGGFQPKSVTVFGKELSRKGYEPLKRKQGNYRSGLALKSSGVTSTSKFGLSALS